MSENVQGISISRPVLNIDSTVADAIYERAPKYGIPDSRTTKVQIVDKPVVNILKTGEIFSFLRFLNLTPFDFDFDEFANYLADNLPDSVDEQLQIASCPILETIEPGKKHVALFSIANNNLTVLNERKKAQELVKEFFNVDLNCSYEWSEHPAYTSLWVVTERHAKLIPLFRDLLNKEIGIFPEFIHQGAASIDDTETLWY